MAGEDREYLELVRRQYCCAPGPRCHTMPCDAHHPRIGVVGAAQKGHDRTAIPLCHACHRALHALTGPFKSWDGRMLREWQRDMVIKTQERCIPLLDDVTGMVDGDIPF